jgi:hypothetical protein
MEADDMVLVILAVSVLVAIGGALWSRVKQGKGIGWQFIRFTAIATALPLMALLALSDALTEAATAILAGALGYAFGKPGEEEK